MSTLLAHNHHLSLDPTSWDEARPYPPLGTVALATEMRQSGHDVRVYDAMFATGPEAFADTLDAERPDRVGLVADYHSVPQKMCLGNQRRAALAMVSACAERGVQVLVSSPDATDHPDVYLNAGADVVIRGEPDVAVAAWLNGAPLADLPGAQVEPGELAEPAPARADIDTLPLVDWSLIDLEPYRATWQREHGYWEAPVSTTRGCPYRCNWCAKPIWGRSTRYRPPEQVLAEVEQLLALGVDRIWFADDIFAIQRPWLERFAELMAARGPVPYRCLSRADLVVRPGYAELLAKTGCQELWMGAESGAQSVLDAMTKDVTVEQIEQATDILQGLGVAVGFFLQLGYPGEGLQQMRQTIQMVRNARPDFIGISATYPLPGTPFHARVRDSLLRTHWDSAMDNELLFEPDLPRPFYHAAQTVLRREHRVVRSLQAMRRLGAASPGPRGLAADARTAAGIFRHVPRLPLLHARMHWHARHAPATSPGLRGSP